MRHFAKYALSICEAAAIYFHFNFFAQGEYSELEIENEILAKSLVYLWNQEAEACESQTY